MTGTKVSRAEARRAEAVALHAQQAQRMRRRRSRNRAAAIVAGMLLIAGVGMAVQTQRNPAGDIARTPSGLDAGTGFAVGQASAAVTVEVYEDFLCPACKRFEDLTEATVTSLLDQGRVRVIYRVISILDRASTDAYSTRAMNAAACVGPVGFAAFHRALFAEQPPEGGAGLSDSRLVELAGGGSAVSRCINDQQYAGWVAQATDTASRRGINATPTVVVDGTALRSWAAADLLAAVEQAER